MSPANLYLGLVHYPVYDKKKEVVATAVTNFDIHDIARCARTYGLEGFYIITPLESQVQLTERLIFHWKEGYGATYNPTRKDSLSLARIARTVEEAEKEISSRWQKKVSRVVTGASPHPKNVSFPFLKERMQDPETPFLMLFGTGWGLTRELKDSADYVLAPIEGKGYNHLSVRSAVAIILDRLLGERTISSI
jgi:hypothetical protein